MSNENESHSKTNSIVENSLNSFNQSYIRDVPSPRHSTTPSTSNEQGTRIPSYLFNKPNRNSNTHINNSSNKSPNHSINNNIINRHSIASNHSNVNNNEFRFKSNVNNDHTNTYDAPEVEENQFNHNRKDHHRHHHHREKKRRNFCFRCCCCCCRSRTGALICALFTIVFLIGIGVAAFFLWPRIPEVQVESVTQAGTNIKLDQTDFFSLFSSNNGQSVSKLNINFKVKNNNYIDIVVNQINISGSLASSSISVPNALSGKLAKPSTLKAQATGPFVLPITITLPGTSSSDSNVLKELKTTCDAKQNLVLNYAAQFDLAIISWTGYKPDIKNSFSFKCPWSIS